MNERLEIASRTFMAAARNYAIAKAREECLKSTHREAKEERQSAYNAFASAQRELANAAMESRDED